MGIAYKICNCKHCEFRDNNGENDLSYNNQISKNIFTNRNKKNGYININDDNTDNNPPPSSKGTLEFNSQVNALAKNYKDNIPKKSLNEKYKYNFILKKNLTPRNIKSLSLCEENDENDGTNKKKVIYKSYYNSKVNLKNIRSLLSNQDFKYIGEKSQDKKEGFGIGIWDDKIKYIGTFKKNKANGYGKFIDEKIKYKGQFKDDLACGFGIFANGQELLYIGYWLNDLQEGYGCETWIDNAEYCGEYKSGKKHGLGVYDWSDGSKYEGYWNMNVREGYGIMYYTKEKIYVGEWKNNLKEGFGELLFKDKKYIGFFKQDKNEGFGILYLNKLNKAFMGFWKEGKQFGFGKIMTRNKRKYGIWTEDSLVNWFKSEEEAFDYLTSNGLKNYKTFFLFTLDDIRNYCINNDEFNSLLE